MIFEDDAQRDHYHKAVNSMLQAVVQIFESRCYLYHLQVHLVDVTYPWSVTVILENDHEEVFTEIEGFMNTRFPRKDGYPTCQCINIEYGSFVLYGREATELNNLN